MEYKEIRFEEDIESYLLNCGGYIKGDMTSYDKHKALELDTLIDFIKNTQENAWKRYQTIYGADASDKLYKRFEETVKQQGLIYVLRNGVEDRGVKLKVAYFKPESTLNQDTMNKYDSNILKLTRQFSYSPNINNTIDMVILLNGIPIIALELKNQLTGQSVDNAKKQFMYDRNPREKCFKFNYRFLVYFCVDHYEVFMTTKLAGDKTYFLPFNQGSGGAGNVGGKGNPENKNGYTTSYLWENVLKKDSLMNIINKFIHLSVEKKVEYKNGKEKTKTIKKILFPRYHQLDVVTKLVNDAKENGAGRSYLIQHSAGSGKSNSIAWLAHRLAGLHNKYNEAIFNSIIIVTDRIVLNEQLQETISSFDHKQGVVETIGGKKTSQDLLKAINDGKKIIVTTIQKFPVIYQEVENNTGNKFAIIVDEAHSSQTGTSAQKLKEALADTEEALKEFEKFDTREEENRKDFEDKLIDEILAHGKHQNLSFFAFTATPKQRTLEMFGQKQDQKQDEGTFKPFHVYSMRQAIEEGFILDVLANYTTYKTYYKIGKNIPDNPELPASETREAITRYESLHAYNLQQKTAVIIEHFRANTKLKIKGKAKAMIVTSSRLHAVRYYHEFKKYIQNKGYDDLDILIAFSGTVKDGGQEYTESGMNRTKNGNRVSESQLPKAFNSDEFNMLIVAEKYQTGFDEPLLHTMFVDKRLCGVKAVQTLSRLNRICKDKEDTYVLDFVNTADEIKEAFEPYYEQTTLDQEINVNMVYDIKNAIRNYRIYNNNDVDNINKYLSEAKEKQTDTMLGKFASYYKPVIKSYEEILNDEQKYEFKKSGKNFIKWYSYITQIVRLFDIELHKEYIFLYSLSKLLPNKEKEKVSIDDKVKLEYYKIAETFSGSINLGEEKGELENTKTASNSGKKEEKRELLDIIIDNINARTEGEFTEEDKVILKTMMDKIGKNNNLKKFAEGNDLEMYRNSIFPDVFNKIAQECYTNQMESFKKLFQNKEFYHVIMDELANQTYNQYRNK